MANFFAELKRRQMFRVAAAYAVVAWLIIQLVNNLAPMLRLPEWAGSFFLVALIVGFPIALIFAWIHELKPEGDALKPVTAGKLDWALFAALILVIALVSYQQLPRNPTAIAEKQPGVEAAKAAAASPAEAISLAVLPFANLSGDASQEFFSDGMTEEITSALAKVPGLRMVARASAFQFKGERNDMRTVGQALNARYLIDGSVRKAGTRVRISAQLIEAGNGLQMWTENYDRELTDIFATQEDIARAIAASLRVPLGLQQGENLVNSRGIDPESYQQYLRGRALVRGRLELNEAITLLEQVVAGDPDFAPAWAQLALAYALLTNRSLATAASASELRRVSDPALSKAEEDAQRAIRLDATLADAYVSIARASEARGKLVMAEESYSKALALDPSNPEALSLYANMLAGVGRLEEALTLKQRALALEPFVPVYQGNTAWLLWLNGQTDEAIAKLKAMGTGGLGRLSVIYAAAGRYSEAADALAAFPPGAIPQTELEQATRLLRTAPSPVTSAQNLAPMGPQDFIYAYVGAPERVLDSYERNVEGGYAPPFFTAFLWDASYAPVRKLERFKALMRNMGLVDYWRAKGWPEFCRPVGADDFVCE